MKLVQYGETVPTIMFYRGDKNPNSATTYIQNKSELIKQLNDVEDEVLDYSMWRLKESMVNLNEKLNLMTSKYCENGNAVKTKIISFFVSNDWFNESPEIINKELYVSDELWENHRDQIEEYCKSSNETSDEKHNKLMKLFERELPETYGYF